MRIYSVGNGRSQRYISKKPKFTTSDGREYKDFSLNKGMATRYGERLTGVAEVENKRGGVYIVDYNNGIMTSSRRKGDSYTKTYSPYETDDYCPTILPRNKAALITDRQGNKVVHMYNTLGKISKIVDPKTGYIEEYSLKGNKVAEYFRGENPCKSVEGKVYYDIKDETPMLKKKIRVAEDGDLLETTYLKNGSILKEKKGGYYQYENIHTGLLAEAKYRSPSEIRSYVAGKLDKTIRRKFNASEESIEVRKGDNVYGIEYTKGTARNNSSRNEAYKYAMTPKSTTGEKTGSGYIYCKGPKPHYQVQKDLPIILEKLKEATSTAVWEDMRFGDISYTDYINDLDALLEEYGKIENM